MNILFINSFEFKDAGGIGRVTETLAKAFQEKSHKVYFVALTKGDDYEFNGVPQFFSPEIKVDSKANITFLKTILHREKIDVIINQGGTSMSVLSAIFKANKVNSKVFTVHHNGIRCLQYYHKQIIMEYIQKSTFFFILNNALVYKILKKISKIRYSLYFRKILKMSDKLVLLSPYYIDELEVFVKDYSKEKVAAISNPASFPFLENAEIFKENKLLYVGRITTAQKQVFHLLDIWENLQDKFPKWSFDIVGDGPSLDDLKKGAAKKNLKNIYFYGYADPNPYFKSAKFFLMTSAFEGFPMVLNEALSYGVYPIAFDSFSAVREIIDDNITGKLITPFDTKEYVSELEKLMLNESLRLSGIKKAKNVLEKFEPDSIAGEWDKLIRSTKK